ncbi:MAG: class I SAM-dependent methyltransferase [Pseudomonadota bacterium]
MSNPAEPQAVQARYARRDAAQDALRYQLMASASALQAQQERLRALVRLWNAHGWTGLSDMAITEVGCGAGGNLQDLLRLGANPARLQGLELIAERAAQARAGLPGAVRIVEGDATLAPVADGSQHALLAFTLFSSLLDPAFRQHMADVLWRWAAPGGGVLVYDFIVDNPRNPDVRGVPLAELRRLFPAAQVQSRRITLAPPIARRLPAAWLAPASALLHPLRTHRLTWLAKPA